MTAAVPHSALTGQFPRLSDRFNVSDISLSCTVPNNRKLFGKKTASVDMKVVDLSVAGALLVGPKLESVKTGSKIPFEHDGQGGIVEVRHVRPATDVPDSEGSTYYGVVFLNITGNLKDLIFDRMAQRRGRKQPELDQLWNTAR